MALATNLISYYPLNANSTDSVGANSGTDTAISYATAGKIGNCATLARASSSKIVVGTNAGLQPASALTFSKWIYINNAPVSFCSIGGDTIAGSAFGYVFDMDTTSINFRIGNGTWGSVSTTFTTGAWIHLVGTWDGTTATLYKNGVSVGTPTSKASITYTGCGLSFGNYYTDTTSANMFDGRIDEVGIWSRALTADEISQIYNSGRGNAYPLTDTPSLYGGVAYYKLEDVADSIDGNTATNVGTATFTSGKIGNALTLNGSSQALTLNAALLNAYATCSISAWFKLGATGAYQRIVSKTDDTTYNQMIRVTNGNKLAGHITTSSESTITGGTTLSSGVWYFATLVYDGANINLYLNGSTDATQVAKTGSLKTATETVSIGRDNQGATTEYFSGQLDEVCIWNRALSSTEVTALYNSGSGNQYPFSISAYVLSCVVGAFTLTGNAVNLSKGYVMQVATGVFNMVGNAVNLVVGGQIWTNIAKSVTSWTNGTKASTAWNNEDKSSTTWTNINKS